MYSILPEPPPEEAIGFLTTKINRELLVIFADCNIDYIGRASSRAELASRLIILKPDGTVIIHESTKREPLNWQPPGTKVIVYPLGESVVIRAERRRPHEILDIHLEKIYYIASSNVNHGDFKIVGKEADIINIVIRQPELIEDGFKVIGREYKTPYGKIDLLGVDKKGRYFVLEFKRTKAELQAVSQLYRYYIYFKETFGERVRGGLVAPDITSHALELLKKLGLEYIKIETSKIRELSIRT